MTFRNGPENRWGKILLVVILTFLFQLVADHILRATLNHATYLFVDSVAADCGLLALLIVKLIRRSH